MADQEQPGTGFRVVGGGSIDGMTPPKPQRLSPEAADALSAVKAALSDMKHAGVVPPEDQPGTGFRVVGGGSIDDMTPPKPQKQRQR